MLFIDKFKSYFPKNKTQWKEFSWFSVPVIVWSLFFALNSFIDNFMVGSIKGATAGLLSVNSWTAIIIGIFTGSAATGSILVSQYYYSNQYNKIREIAKIRYIITIIVSLSFAIPTWFIPEQMVKAFLSEPKKIQRTSNILINDYKLGIDQGIIYIKYIGFMWILMAFTFNLGNMSRETGHAKYPLIAVIFGLVINILLNYLTIKTEVFGKFQADGASIATTASRATVFLVLMLFVVKKNVPIIFFPWTIFNISKTIHKQFWYRSSVFIFTSMTMIFITLRNKIYATGYPAGSIQSSDGSSKIGAADMLGITWSIFGVISVVFESTNIIVSKFIGGELGKNNIKLAVDNSRRIHGFMFMASIPFIIFGIIFIFIIPEMTFLQETNDKNRDKLVLGEAALSMIGMIIFLSWWNWFTTSKSVVLAGGKVNLVAIIDVVTSGPLFLGWISIVMMVIVPNTNIPFWIAYIICFIADIPRGITFLWVYYRKKWAFNLTK